MFVALIRKELLVLSRDVHGLLALFLLPVAFIILMSMALKDIYSPPVNNLNWALMDQDNSALSQTFIADWGISNGKPVVLPSDWELALREGRLSYIIHIKKGAQHDFLQVDTSDEPRIILQADPTIDAAVLASLNAKIKALTTTLRAKSVIQKLSSLGEPGVEGISAEMIQATGLVEVRRLNSAVQPTSVQHNVPAWLVFGMFFVVTSIAGLFVEERGNGTLNRLISLGVGPLQLLLTKALPFLLINYLQAGLMLGVGVYFVPLIGGDALALHGVNITALLLMLFCISLAAICCALLIAALVKSQAQASAIGPMLSVFLAAVGGIMVPTFVMPLAMQRLAQFSPMNWALQGLLDVLLQGSDVRGIVTEGSYLLILAAVSICFAYFAIRLKNHDY